MVLYTLAGKKAITEVFQVANRIYSNGYDDIFVRKGGLQQAEKDFMKIMSVDPKAVKEKKTKAPIIVSLHRLLRCVISFEIVRQRMY